MGPQYMCVYGRRSPKIHMIRLTRLEDAVEMKRDRGQDAQPCSECILLEGLHGRKMQLKRRVGCGGISCPPILARRGRQAGRRLCH